MSCEDVEVEDVMGHVGQHEFLTDAQQVHMCRVCHMPKWSVNHPVTEQGVQSQVTNGNGYEAVDHPPHYNDGLIEHVAYAEDRGWAPGYHLGNATKYLHRAGKKPGTEAVADLRKAAWYIHRLIAWLEHGDAIWQVPRKP